MNHDRRVRGRHRSFDAHDRTIACAALQSHCPAASGWLQTYRARPRMSTIGQKRSVAGDENGCLTFDMRGMIRLARACPLYGWVMHSASERATLKDTPSPLPCADLQGVLLQPILQTSLCLHRSNADEYFACHRLSGMGSCHMTNLDENRKIHVSKRLRGSSDSCCLPVREG